MPALSADELAQLLLADVPYGDLTSHNLGLDRRQGSMHFSVRDAMCCCGIEEAAALLTIAGAHVEVAQTAAGRAVHSGDMLAPGTPLLSAYGPAHALFRGWKCAQALIESCSGISSAAAALVAAANGTAVACTRKHFPGIKALASKAVVAGGATMHRLGLSETLLITAEHRQFMTDTELAMYVGRLQRKLPEKKVVVEVSAEAEALALIEAGVDVLQLEKFNLGAIARIVTAAHAAGVKVAAAGGINLANIGAHAATGADVLVTTAPFFASPRDVQVRFSWHRPDIAVCER